MTTFLISLLPASLFIYGIHILFQEGNIFEKQGEWITNKVGEYWSKPLINCPACMSSVWGTLWFFVFIPFLFQSSYLSDVSDGFDFYVNSPELKQQNQLFVWPFYCLCLCGWHAILAKLTTKERIIVEE